MREKPFAIIYTILLSVLAASAQVRITDTNATIAYLRAHYAKHEYQIPMRDGVKLFTAVYSPLDTNQAYPMLMQRTPYSIGAYGSNSFRAMLGPSDLFTKEGFIFVFQDVRGRYMSEGIFEDVSVKKAKLNGPKDTDESTDSYDTIDWLVKNVPNNNGRVGSWGISYPGFFSAFSLLANHPALKCASPQAPMADVGNGDDAYHNGAFFLAANFGFYTGFYPRGPEPGRSQRSPRFDYGTTNEYDFYLRMGPLKSADDLAFHHTNTYWTDLVSHPNYDSFWSSRALAPHMRGLTAAVLVVGGWFDAEDLGGTPRLFQAITHGDNFPGNTLVMGPWSHGGWSGRGNGDRLGNLSFTSKTSAFYRENIEFPFFMQNLKPGRLNAVPEADIHLPKAWVFATGANEWHKFESWPPTNIVHHSLYLAVGGKLSFTSTKGKTTDFDQYISDPANPVPVLDVRGPGMPGDYMTYDQRFASARPDVLTYQTAPLEHDVTIAGPITPVLRVSTSGTDSDFDVKLIDVYPDDTPVPIPNPRNVHLGGYQQLVRGEPFRGKFRNSMSQPRPFKPNQPAEIEFAMPDVMHVFKAGHRIMVQIQSSWFPLTDRNPQTFVDIPRAKESDFKKATECVYRGGADGSRIDVLISE